MTESALQAEELRAPASLSNHVFLVGITIQDSVAVENNSHFTAFHGKILSHL